MNIKKFMVGGIIGGITNFFLGWLVWGMLLRNFMQSHINPSAQAAFRTEEHMVWWALVVGNFALGFLAAYVLLKAGIKTASAGASTGAVLGLLYTAGISCINYAQMKIYGLKAMGVDILAATVVMGVVGAIIGWYLGRDNK